MRKYKEKLQNKWDKFIAEYDKECVMCCEKNVTYKIMRGTNCFGEIETKIFDDDYEFNNEQLITGLYKAGYINTDCVNDYFIEGRSDGVLVVYVVYNIEYRYALFRLEEI